MTQPPDEPPPGDPWQPPGPQPAQPTPAGQNPHGQNPYGGETTSFYQIDSGGMGNGVKVTLGVVIGLFAGFVLWFVALILFATSSSGNNLPLLFAAVAPLVVPAPLLIWQATRPWAVGLLIGTAVTTIGLSSLCSAMVNNV